MHNKTIDIKLRDGRVSCLVQSLNGSNNGTLPNDDSQARTTSKNIFKLQDNENVGSRLKLALLVEFPKVRL